jgi:hypothetical protein
MKVKFESGDRFLLATAEGAVSLNDSLELGKNICNAAGKRGFSEILIDCSKVTGELSALEQYDLGKTMAEYCLAKQSFRSRPPIPKVAIIGKPPTITGFAAQVARNRGLSVQTFPELRPALDWLTALGFKAAAAS